MRKKKQYYECKEDFCINFSFEESPYEIGSIRNLLEWTKSDGRLILSTKI